MTADMEPPIPDDIGAIVNAISPILKGRTPAIQSAVLADLVATFVAGHRVEGDRAATRDLRQAILATHTKYARALVSLHAQLIHGEHEP